MLYKTIVLNLLQQRPQIHNQLRSNRTLMATAELHARELRSSLEAWKDRLSRARPGSHQSQIASEALEIALNELADTLKSNSLPEDGEQLSTEGAMAFIRRHSRSG